MDGIKEILKICKNIVENFPLSLITSFRTGGPARFFVSPSDIEEIKGVLDICNQYNLPLIIIGKGTNILISDNGFDGLVLSTKNFNKVVIQGTDIYCQSGVLLSSLLKICIKKELKGIEFLSGIPGTVGGAIISNAGLKDVWISEKVVKVDVISLSNGQEKVLKRQDINFGYRKSGLENYFISGVFFHLNNGVKEEIKKTISEYMKKRIETQPLGYPSAGSIFKNPPGLFAGKIIEECGLKGYSIGGACISEKHANFIINKGGATSEDIYKLIIIVKEQVKKMYNIELETEIKIIGSFPVFPSPLPSPQRGEGKIQRRVKREGAEDEKCE
ncbi:MAG: UDP-N-acetylmuramate dehydrogenase [Candidatus Omnitrophica bacterium]|nr:UDP-N-acetylmuramate dehydrogenase [Candidatus Omnitrophota bacterium]MCM8777547.1 UDP-N-acetylmuramate dehydrogenase [Candidatus Omnitrophota bacterium]